MTPSSSRSRPPSTRLNSRGGSSSSPRTASRRPLFAPHIIEPRAWCGGAELEPNAAENAGHFGGIAHVDVRTFPSADPNEVWVTSRTGREATFHGHPYAHWFLHYFLLENGRINLWREYLNASVLLEASKPLRSRTRAAAPARRRSRRRPGRAPRRECRGASPTRRAEPSSRRRSGSARIDAW